jgi:hypothetical protein
MTVGAAFHTKIVYGVEVLLAKPTLTHNHNDNEV